MLSHRATGTLLYDVLKTKLEIRVVRVKIEAKVYLEKHEVNPNPNPAWAASHDVCDAGSRDGYIQRALVRTK